MLDTLYIEDVTQADALLKPKRVQIMRELAEPATCTQIGGVLGETPQAIYYHVKRLQAAGLVSLVEERRVRGIVEGIYQAVARSFWVSPAIAGRLGPERAPRGHARARLPAEPDRRDVARPRAARRRPVTLPSFGIAGDVTLSPEDGAAFVAELQRAFGEVLSHYGGGEGHTFRLALACYPHHPPPVRPRPSPSPLRRRAPGTPRARPRCGRAGRGWPSRRAPAPSASPTVRGDLLHDLPVAELARLGHAEELEAVERLLLAGEVGLHHLHGFGLGLAGLLADRGLAALEVSIRASVRRSVSAACWTCARGPP